jgi:hypothetical protein
MLRTVEVLRRVLVLGLIAASDVTTGHAQSQMNPCVPRLQAVLTSICARCDFSDLIEVRTSTNHILVSLFSAW